MSEEEMNKIIKGKTHFYENDTLTTGTINNDRITISNCVYYEEPLLERIDKLQIENEKLKKENERLKQYKEDNFLYDFEELQDKVLKLQKDNQELKRIVDALEMAKQNIPKGTQFVIVAEEDYLRNIKIINERNKVVE